MPKRLEPITAIFAGPPRKRPISAMAMSLKKFEPPERIKSRPISTNGMMITTVICRITPSRPLLSMLR